VSEANRGSFIARQPNHLRPAQVRPARQHGSEVSVRSRDYPVDKVCWQRRVLGQSVERAMHKTIVPGQRLDGQRFTTTVR
jgi:hypothetical protein